MTAPFGYVGTELELFREARNWKRYLRRQLASYLRGDVLEVGAGTGNTTVMLHAADCDSWTCLEPDRALIAELSSAVENLRDRAGRGPAQVVGMLADLDPASRYDTILYIDVLEHIQHDRREVAEAAARLRPGGCLIVLSPAHQWLMTAFDVEIGHVRRYDKQALRALSPEGTTLTCLRYLDCVGIAASLGNRLIIHDSMPSPAQIQVWDRFMVPLSSKLDALFGYHLGKSVLAIWRR